MPRPAGPAYSAPGGTPAGASRPARRAASAPLWVGAFVRADSLAGAAFDASPLVRRSENVTFGLALSWVLRGLGRTQVPDER